MNQQSQPQAGDKSRSWYVYLVAFVASTGGFLFGYDLVIISGANEFLREQFHLTNDQFGAVTSSASIGCMMGPFLGMWLCDWIGRRRTLMVAGLLFAIGAIGTALPEKLVLFPSWNVVQAFNVLRIIGGVGVGLASLASPMYIAEIAPAAKRGALGFLYFVALVVGAALSVLVAYFLSKHLPKTISWRWMFASALVPIAGLLVCLLFVPYSPRWLAGRGRRDEAFRVLARIDGEEHARREMQEIDKALAEERGGWLELFQPSIFKALLFGSLLALFHNWTGWSSIAYYQPTIFLKAGAKTESASILMMAVVMSVNIIFAITASLLADRVGRRKLWNFAAAGMIISTFVTGIFFYQKLGGMIVLVFFLLCSLPHHMGLAPVPWLMMSEIFPNRIRAKAVAITTTVLWFAGWSGARVFPLVAEWSNKKFDSIAGVFWIFSGINVLALIFGLIWMPETKGRSLEQIWLHWEAKSHSRGTTVGGTAD